MVSWGREYIGPHTWNGMLFFDMVVASISPVLVFHLVLCVCYDRLPLKGVGTLRLGVGVGGVSLWACHCGDGAQHKMLIGSRTCPLPHRVSGRCS